MKNLHISKRILTVVSIALICTVGSIFYFRSANSNNTNLKKSVTDIPEKSETKIIAFGDSLTAGYGLTLDEAYPAQLEVSLRKMGYAVSVINSGVSGETSRGNKERAQFIASQNGDIVILGIGGNDALRLLSVEDAKKNIKETIDILKAGKTPPRSIVLLKMQAPLTAGLQYKKNFDALYKEVAEEKGLVLVPFLTTELFLDSANRLPDGIHYNKEGYRKAVEMYVAPAIAKILKK